MKIKTEDTILKIVTLISFIAMIFVNVLAVTLPINGISTGEVSDAYPNLFTPAGYTFAVWGVIYILLGAFSFFQLGWPRSKGNKVKHELQRKIRIYFIVSSIANVLWIFAWHYRIIPLSLMLMLIILLCLIWISRINAVEKLSLTEKIFVRLPFSIYFGWITVATVANVTVMLVSLGWNGFGISQTVWTIAVLIVSMIIGMVTIFKSKDIAYGLVLAWAFSGILSKHISENGFNSEYPAIIVTISICIVLITSELIYILLPKRYVSKHVSK